MKKGFTLVELSIVLVIIGILLGMVVKGKSLIETARLKSDLGTVNKIKIAVAGFSADNNANFGTSFNETRLTNNSKYLSTSDLTPTFADTAFTVRQVTITAPTYNTSGVATAGGRLATATTGNDIAVIFGSTEPDRRFSCYYDASVDDGIPGLGDTMVLGTTAGAITAVTADTCLTGTAPSVAEAAVVF